MAVEEASSSSGEEGSGGWTREQEKAFENALATTEEEEGDAMWENIAEVVEGKTAEEVRQHYELLVEDVDGIESGRVPLPVYAGDGDAEEGSGGGGKKGLVLDSWYGPDASATQRRGSGGDQRGGAGGGRGGGRRRGVSPHSAASWRIWETKEMIASSCHHG